MFIAGFSKELQTTFLNLAYTMVYADGRLDEREQLLLARYSVEIDPSIDMAQICKVDFAEGLAEFDVCSTSDKQKIFFELYAIALIDESYPDEEKNLVDMAKERFNISDNKTTAMKAAFEHFIDAYKKLNATVVE